MDNYILGKTEYKNEKTLYCECTCYILWFGHYYCFTIDSSGLYCLSRMTSTEWNKVKDKIDENIDSDIINLIVGDKTTIFEEMMQELHENNLNEVERG